MDTSFYTNTAAFVQPTPKSRLQAIKYLICDVDGTMTDGGIYYDESGNELKKFNTRDAAGFFCAKISGIQIIVLTGRECAATLRRMKELQVQQIQQNVRDKVQWMMQFMKEEKLIPQHIAYIGDDLNDLGPMQLAGYVGCPLDAFPEIKAIAHYISDFRGGEGAVRDFVTHILKERGQWEMAYQNAYHIGI